MADISTLPSRSTAFTGPASGVQPVFEGQIFSSGGLLYVANSTTIGDLTAVSGVGGGGSSFVPGFLRCRERSPFLYESGSASNQSLSGKAIEFLRAGTYTMNIAPSTTLATEIATAPDPSKTIEVYRWSQLPSSLAGTFPGREWLADLPAEGGSVSVTIDAVYKWLSVGVRTTSAGVHEGVFLLWNQTTDICLWTTQRNLVVESYTTGV